MMWQFKRQFTLYEIAWVKWATTIRALVGMPNEQMEAVCFFFFLFLRWNWSQSTDNTIADYVNEKLSFICFIDTNSWVHHLWLLFDSFKSLKKSSHTYIVNFKVQYKLTKEKQWARICEYIFMYSIIISYAA